MVALIVVSGVKISLVLVSYVVAVLAGGYGGYKYGSYVERKAAAALAAAGKAVGSAAGKV